jgi:hypothetical protein
MKKICFVLAVLLFLASSNVFANESEYYARTFQIEKVYPHRLGYKVLYLTARLSYAATYLPHKWFSQSATKNGQQAKGELAWGNDPTYPYMIVFWKDGKFSHVRLFLKKDMHDISYGVISPQQDPAQFEVDEIALEY